MHYLKKKPWEKSRSHNLECYGQLTLNYRPRTNWTCCERKKRNNGKSNEIKNYSINSLWQMMTYSIHSNRTDHLLERKRSEAGSQWMIVIISYLNKIQLHLTQLTVLTSHLKFPRKVLMKTIKVRQAFPRVHWLTRYIFRISDEMAAIVRTTNNSQKWLLKLVCIIYK